MSNSEQAVEKVVIIGSGPAGWSASIYAARANLDPLTFEGAATEENRLGGTLPLGQLSLTTEVENYAGFPAGKLAEFLRTAIDDSYRPMLEPFDERPHAVTGPELMHLMRQQAKNFGTRIVTDDVVDVDFASRPFTLRTLEGRTHRAQAVIIATGARANYLGLPSETEFKNRGVSACAVCDGALPRFRNQPVVVVGGGDSAVEEATHLTKYASVVHLVHRRGELRASRIMRERAQNHAKIDLVWFHVVDEVMGNDKDGLTAVRIRHAETGATRELPARGMFVAIGHTPNTRFLEGKLDLNDKGHVVWKKAFRTATSVDGVFAAGDVADDRYRQAITSAGTGCMAALDAERWLAERNL
ncbi:MAG: thioredoxin-disulfide reductase [Planctomycetes bacterium]|nr:thioredoxin-disulfide reductase [Planctomycetota bacterium]